jgi:hypothetical protein
MSDQRNERPISPAQGDDRTPELTSRAGIVVSASPHH